MLLADEAEADEKQEPELFFDWQRHVKRYEKR